MQCLISSSALSRAVNAILRNVGNRFAHFVCRFSLAQAVTALFDSAFNEVPIRFAGDTMAPKLAGGIRKRLGIIKPVAKQPAAKSVQSPRVGGIRSRMNVGKDSTKKAVRAKAAAGPLTKILKQKWGTGKMSAKDVAEIFTSAASQGATNVPVLSKLSNPQNLHRSLVAAFGHPEGAPEFFWATIPTKSGPTPHPFLLPHLWLASLFACLPDLFNVSVRGPVDAARNYWSKIKDTGFFKKHPGLDRDKLDKTIPIGMHGDGGAFSDNDSLFVLTWNSLIGCAVTMKTRFLMIVLKESEMIEGALAAAMSAVCVSGGRRWWR